MYYRAVGNRCAVDFDDFVLPIERSQVIELLERKGFRRVQVNIVALARECVGRSTYRRGARLREAPEVVDCSSLVKWLYGQRGVWVPRRSIQQAAFGTQIWREVLSGDLVFTSGHRDYYDTDPNAGIGHVGIVTDSGTVIHAANQRSGVIETALNDFCGDDVRAIRRLIPANRLVPTFELPPGREIETSDDIRWVILQSLPYPSQPT